MSRAAACPSPSRCRSGREERKAPPPLHKNPCRNRRSLYGRRARSNAKTIVTQIVPTGRNASNLERSLETSGTPRSAERDQQAADLIVGGPDAGRAGTPPAANTSRFRAGSARATPHRKATFSKRQVPSSAPCAPVRGPRRPVVSLLLRAASRTCSRRALAESSP